MNKKLTLFVDDVSIKRAKRFAKKRNVSVSKMVEAYLNAISLEEGEVRALPPVTSELLGVLKVPGKTDLTKEYAAYLEDKYQ